MAGSCWLPAGAWHGHWSRCLVPTRRWRWEHALPLEPFWHLSRSQEQWSHLLSICRRLLEFQSQFYTSAFSAALCVIPSIPLHSLLQPQALPRYCSVLHTSPCTCLCLRFKICDQKLEGKTQTAGIRNNSHF